MPNPGAAAARLKGRRRATVVVAGHVPGVIRSADNKPKPFAGQSGPVVALSACKPDCAPPELHDEIGVRLGTKVYWFRASELRREPSVIGPESPRRPSKRRHVAKESAA